MLFSILYNTLAHSLNMLITILWYCSDLHVIESRTVTVLGRYDTQKYKQSEVTITQSSSNILHTYTQLFVMSAHSYSS